MHKWAAFWTLALVYGSGFLFISIAVEQLNPFELVFLRTLIGTIGLGSVLLLRRQRIPTDWPTVRIFLLLGVVNLALPFTLVSWAQQTVDSGLTSVLISTNPLFALLIAHFAFADDRITIQKFLGIVAGFIGVVILASRNWQDGQVITGGLTGQLAIVSAAFCFALSATISRKLMQRQVEPIAVATGTVSVAMVIVGFLAYVVLPLVGGPEPTPIATWEPETVMAVLVLGFSSTILNYLLLYFVIRELGVSRTSTVAYLLPPISITLGVIFRDEVLDVTLLLGAAVILSGIAISNLRLRRLARAG